MSALVTGISGTCPNSFRRTKSPPIISRCLCGRILAPRARSWRRKAGNRTSRGRPSKGGVWGSFSILPCTIIIDFVVRSPTFALAPHGRAFLSLLVAALQPALAVALFLASPNHCCIISQPKLLLYCWPVLTIAIPKVSSNCFFASSVAILAVAWSLGDRVLGPACPGTACETCPPFPCSPGLCLAASYFSSCCILSI